jgi:hypothetical protein
MGALLCGDRKRVRINVAGAALLRKGRADEGPVATMKGVSEGRSPMKALKTQLGLGWHVAYGASGRELLGAS